MTAIKKIIFSDFKKFSKYHLTARPINIITGPNNAGKSSILDAVRILSDVIRYSKRRRPSLEAHDDFGVCATYTLSHEQISISCDNFVRNYGDDPARITFEMDNGAAVHIRLHPDSPIIAFLQTPGKMPTTSTGFRRCCDIDIVVVPTLSPFEMNETYVTDQTVERNEFTRLAARNFRNIVARKDDAVFEKLKDLCRDGWSDIELMRPHTETGLPAKVTMLYEEKRIPREIYWSGFGFQVWLQMMLQFLRAKEKSILVLDEPDVYMHPDLQKKMLRIAKKMFSQVFLATHSTEIINEADAGEVLLVDSSGRSARRISSQDEYKKVYSYLGSTENAEFSRLAKAERIIFFEGKDRKILRRFAKTAGISEIFDDPATLYLQAGGFGQWARVKETNWVLKSIFNIDAKIAAIFDRDYRSSEEVSEFEENMKDADIWVGVLQRKEIENYALVRAPLLRTIKERLAERNSEVTTEEVETFVNRIIGGYKGDCQARLVSNTIQHRMKKNPKLDHATLLKPALAEFESNWADPSQRLHIVPGKEFFSVLNSGLQANFKSTITINQIIENMSKDEVPVDLVDQMKSMAKFLN